MTDSDIIKALECCTRNGECSACPMRGLKAIGCIEILVVSVLDLIKRQQAEIERLKTEKDNLIRNYKECAMEAVRDFAGRLEDRLPPRDSDYCVHEYRQVLFYIDRIVEEMEG